MICLCIIYGPLIGRSCSSDWQAVLWLSCVYILCLALSLLFYTACEFFWSVFVSGASLFLSLSGSLLCYRNHNILATVTFVAACSQEVCLCTVCISTNCMCYIALGSPKLTMVDCMGLCYRAHKLDPQDHLAAFHVALQLAILRQVHTFILFVFSWLYWDRYLYLVFL